MKHFLTLMFVAGVFFSASAPAGSPRPPSVAEQTKRLNPILLDWQRKFGLQDVRLNFQVVEMRQIAALTNGTPSLGASGPTPKDNVYDVFVLVLRAQDYPVWADQKKVQKDQQATILHELLHIMYHLQTEEREVTILEDLLVSKK